METESVTLHDDRTLWLKPSSGVFQEVAAANGIKVFGRAFDIFTSRDLTDLRAAAGSR